MAWTGSCLALAEGAVEVVEAEHLAAAEVVEAAVAARHLLKEAKESLEASAEAEHLEEVEEPGRLLPARHPRSGCPARSARCPPQAFS